MPSRKVAFYAPGGGALSFKDALPLVAISCKSEEIFDRVKKVTRVDVLHLAGVKEPELDAPTVQVGSLAIGYARNNALNERGIFADYLVGVSSGEFTMAAIGKVISLENAAETLYERGKSQEIEAGGMGGAFIVIHDRRSGARHLKHAISAALSDFKSSHLSGDHTPSKTLVSFVESEKALLKEKLEKIEGVKRVMALKNLRYPPHGEHVEGTERWMEAIMGTLVLAGELGDSSVEMLSTRTARPMRRAQTIAKNLVLQTTEPTNLRGCVFAVLRKDVLDHYDLGPGNSMSNSLEDFDLGPGAIIHPVDDYSPAGVGIQKK
jgi:hypothetical protein